LFATRKTRIAINQARMMHIETNCRSTVCSIQRKSDIVAKTKVQGRSYITKSVGCMNETVSVAKADDKFRHRHGER